MFGERLAADQERVLGADHPGTLSSRGNLGLAYQAAGRTAEAKKLNRLAPDPSAISGQSSGS